jgi:hypothetical protein
LLIWVCPLRAGAVLLLLLLLLWRYTSCPNVPRTGLQTERAHTVRETKGSTITEARSPIKNINRARLGVASKGENRQKLPGQ